MHLHDARINELVLLAIEMTRQGRRSRSGQIARSLCELKSQELQTGQLCSMHSAPRLMCRRGQTLWLQMGMLGASGALGPWGPGARASPGAKNFRFDSRSRTCSGHTRHGNRLRLQRCPGLVYRMASAWRSASRNSAAQPSKSGLCSMARSLRKSRSRRPERSGEDRTGTEGS